MVLPLVAVTVTAALTPAQIVAISATVGTLGTGAALGVRALIYRYITHNVPRLEQLAKDYYCRDTAVNYLKAKSYDEKILAIDPNHKPSLYRLAIMYQKGYGVVKDLEKAQEYYQTLAILGEEEAIKQGLIIGNQNLVTDSQWFALGEHYYLGQSGKSKDYQKARICFEEALQCNSLHKKSLYNLGNIYYFGQGISVDLHRGQKYHSTYKLLVEQDAHKNLAAAQYEFGYNYYHKLQKNAQQAIHWCLLAAEQGHQQALNYLTNTTFNATEYLILAQYYDKKQGSANRALAIQFFKQASKSGDSTASLRLGQLYQSSSQGLDQNLNSAFKYYLKAVTQNCKEALLPLINLEKKVDKVLQKEFIDFYKNHKSFVTSDIKNIIRFHPINENKKDCYVDFAAVPPVNHQASLSL